MKHKHHIVPRHMGGTDDPSNLIELSVEEHAEAHKQLYEKYGKKEDYIAWKGIEHTIPVQELVSIKCSIGGQISGRMQAEQGLGFHLYKSNPELHKQNSSKGGLASGQFQKKEFQTEIGRRGGVKNVGFVWINDGRYDYKYTSKKQELLSVEDFLSKNTNYKLGRIIHDVVCPHCGKVGTSLAAMHRHHFNNCKGKKKND